VSDRKTVTVVMELTESQAAALEDMLYTWNRLGSWGSSRWTAFYADGDGDFKPKARINGRKPQPSTPQGRWTAEPGQLGHTGNLLPRRDRQWGDGMYWMDFDSVAWALEPAQ
jgi:hypothetical protein